MTRFPLPFVALTAGALSAFAFQPVGWWPLMILAIAALCELIARAGSLKKALLTGWLFGLGQFVVGLNWIPTSFTYQANMPAWLGWVALVLLSLYLAVYPMLAAGLAWRFGKANGMALLLGLAGGWAITEWLRAVMFTGFAWNPIAVTLTDTHLLNASTVIGTYGLSLLVVILAGALWLASQKALRAAGAIAAVVLLAHFFPGPALLQPAADRPIRIVQPNIGQQVKWMPGYEEIAAAKLNKLSSIRDQRQELIFWPEAAVTEPLGKQGGNQ